MTLPEMHLAEEAVTAYVDGLLSPSADERARRHLGGCPECRADVDAQREIRSLLGGAPDPTLPPGLFDRLMDVPMTAPLGGPGSDDAELVLSADGAHLGWAPVRRSGFGPRLVERTRADRIAEPVGAGAPLVAATATAFAPVRRPAAPAVVSRPAGRTGPGRPAVPVSMPRRLRRHRRGLAVSLAGLAFGVIASAGTGAAPGTAAPAPGTVLPGQTPAQLTTVSNRSPLQATTFSFSRSSGSTDLVTDRAAAPR